MQQKSYLINDQFLKYQFLAVKIATRYKSFNIDLADLIQASYLGLITGLNKCDIDDEKHKINYLSKYILSEIINTLKSYNKYNYSKEYFKTNKILKDNENMSLSNVISKYNLKKEVVLDIVLKDEPKEEVIDNNEHFLNERQKKIYNLVLRKYSITKIAKVLNDKRTNILKEVKEIYNIIKK